MTTTTGRRVFVDTNILLIASTPARAGHEMAVAVLNEWPNDGVQLYQSGQIVREYLVVATRACSFNGLGLELEQALHNTRAMSSRCVFLEETEAVCEQLHKLARQTRTTGKQLHDANVVATALVHGVTEILTQNVEDFYRFAKLIKITSLE